MCEIDNLCYHFGLAERTRARVEDAGRVELADDQAAAIARSKEVHIIVIVATVLLGVSMAGGAWAASENGDGYLRSPMSRMGPSFALPAIGLWAVAMFEATERGMDHRNTVLGLHTRVVSHTNRVAEIAMRIGWIFIVRIVTVPLVVMFFGAATWGFGENREGPLKADEAATRTYWESKGENWTRMVTAAVDAGRGPAWADPEGWFEEHFGP